MPPRRRARRRVRRETPSYEPPEPDAREDGAREHEDQAAAGRDRSDLDLLATVADPGAELTVGRLHVRRLRAGHELAAARASDRLQHRRLHRHLDAFGEAALDR